MSPLDWSYPDNIPVFGCPDLKPNGHLLSLHVISGNPMQSKADLHVRLAARIIREVCRDRAHQAAFIATDKDGKHMKPVEDAIRESFGSNVKIIRLLIHGF